MFVRIKEVGGRRYVYVAEGVRVGKQVKQKTYYLGPLSDLANGVPDDLKLKVEAKYPKVKDWNMITEAIKRIPLKFEEISHIKPEQYALLIKAKSIPLKTRRLDEKATPSMVFKQRRDGELLALSIIVKKRFQETYTELSEGKPRMEL